MTRTTTAMLFLMVTALTSCRPDSDNPDLITGRDLDYRPQGTPAAITLSDSQAGEETPVCVTLEGQRQPGQVERVDEQTVRVWFLHEGPVRDPEESDVEIGENCSVALFSWQPVSSHETDLVLNGRPVLQYFHPVFDPDDIESTKKPFHHVYAPDGSRHITKGLGGLYPHHRGIYFGYNHVYLNDDERVDIWHAAEGEHSEHQETLHTYEGPVFGGHVVRIYWTDRQGEPVIEETRELRAFRQPEGELLIDFKSTLESLGGTIRLDGDRQHAGVQFRAAQYAADNTEYNRYLRPQAWADIPTDTEVDDDGHVDLPWNAYQFAVEDGRYTVAYLSHPDNPAGAEMSERMYGRVGEFFPHELRVDNPLTVRYRFWVADTHEVSRDEVEARYQAYASQVSLLD